MMELHVGADELREQVFRLTHELREVKEYAERVTRELRRYQQSRPPPPVSAEDDLPLQPWAMNMQMMSPLLLAYEERIAEMETVIERSVSLAEQTQVLTRENDALRVELQDRTEQLRTAHLTAQNQLRDAVDKGGDELQDLYRLSVEQNEALAQQNQLLKLQIEKMQQGLVAGQQQSRELQQQSRELQARAAEGTRTLAANHEQTTKVLTAKHEQAARMLTAEHEQATRVLMAEHEQATRVLAAEHEQAALAATAQQEQLIQELHAERQALDDERQALSDERELSESLGRQRTAAELRIEEVTGELVEEVRKREQLHIQADSLQQRLRGQQENLEMYKKSLNERYTVGHDEEVRLRGDLSRATQIEKQLRQQIAMLEQEVLDAMEQLRVAQKDGDATRQEAEQMLPVMESVERQLQDISERHNQTQKKLLEEEQQVGELHFERDSLASTERALRRQVERAESRLQTEVDALKDQQTQEMQAVQSSQKQLLSELEGKLRQSEQLAADSQCKAELVEKQKAWEVASAERMSSVHASERQQLQDDVEQAQQVRLRLERQADALHTEVNRLSAELTKATAEAKEQLMSAHAELTSCDSQRQISERRLATVREELQSCEGHLGLEVSEYARSQASLRQEVSKANEALEAEQRRVSSEKRSLERKLHNSQARAKHEEHRAVELLRAQEALRLRWQQELSREKESLEAQVDHLTKENRSLRERCRGVMKVFALRGQLPAGEEIVHGVAR